MRSLKGALIVTLAAATFSAACWGENVPSLDQVGAVEVSSGAVQLLFGGCGAETVRRVELKLTDDDFEEIVRVLWSVESVEGSAATRFTVGEVPIGFRSVTPLDEPLKVTDHVQLVVTSSKRSIPMSFNVGDLRKDEVLVRRSRYLSRKEFDAQVEQSCTSG